MDEQTVQEFWQNHACGDTLAGGLKERFRGDCDQFIWPDQGTPASRDPCPRLVPGGDADLL